MVTVILRGGLGNQLFQYATGRAHALRTNRELFLDLSRLDRDRGPEVAKRSLHVDSFDISEHYTVKSENSNRSNIISDRVPRALAAISPHLGMRLFGLYSENHPQKFDSHVLDFPSDITLNGYWQSERYFEEYADTLREEITVSEPIRGENAKWYDQIQEASSVSVHIRRGDYVSLGNALPPAYYRQSLTRIHKETGAESLFFFSDDMDWVRTHNEELLPESVDFDVNYVECNDGETAHEDLRLMRTCDSHVIANSTFSWWGAWLDGSDMNRVIAPNYWFDTPVEQLDIIPDRWTTVEG